LRRTTPPPGGCLDDGETLPAGVAREAAEELDIATHPSGLTFVHLAAATVAARLADLDSATAVLREAARLNLG
jgi:ADP-ribose pyrophosphatase YjhB (NUDIX family)